jgi:hypothetical protein
MDSGQKKGKDQQGPESPKALFSKGKVKSMLAESLALLLKKNIKPEDLPVHDGMDAPTHRKRRTVNYRGLNLSRELTKGSNGRESPRNQILKNAAGGRKSIILLDIPKEDDDEPDLTRKILPKPHNKGSWMNFDDDQKFGGLLTSLLKGAAGANILKPARKDAGPPKNAGEIRKMLHPGISQECLNFKQLWVYHCLTVV